MSHDILSDSYSDSYLSAILKEVKTIALVGASANTARPSHNVMQYLLEKGYEVWPINPGLAGQDLLGQKVYASLEDLPDTPDMIDIFRNSDAAGQVTDAIVASGKLPKVIWMQLEVEAPEAAARAEEQGIKVVMNRCPKIEYDRLLL
ncbi:MAG: CoA-binding protein [Rhodobacteraceae bacterium]|nr:CoA-binding protein [Paracoccaceae bacterium]